MIEIGGLTKLYGDFMAVNGLSFSVRAGEVMGLVGPNGAGKTTTLRCLAGIIPPTHGSIVINGCDLAQNPVAAKAQLAFFPDEPKLFDYLTVWQHLVFVARIYQVENFAPRGEALLSELELADKRNSLPAELSRGMKQKLAIACGLLHSPKALYFDEPLTGLDPLGIRKMKASIVRRAQEGSAIILSSHLLHLVEEICSHILILKNGKMIAHGTMAEITQRFATEPGANLEDVFFNATGDAPAPSSTPTPPAPPPIISP
ncbi:MAG TPA: ABC transporter ATP-binding protein [Opitutales bacterium]|jgi:ABC-2 type transport system ATP-binding protein|nr:ABC transporter ATP-binding protein [Opitutales bacterium]